MLTLTLSPFTCGVIAGIFGTILVEVLLVWATNKFKKGQ